MNRELCRRYKKTHICTDFDSKPIFICEDGSMRVKLIKNSSFRVSFFSEKGFIFQ